jgi:hypothetical protein
MFMSDGRAETGRVALSAPVSFLSGAEAAAAVCPFLGGLDDVGILGDAVPAYSERNRCTAYGPWLPQGRLQQELVCLTVAHQSCPRYTRGLRFGPSGPRRRRRLGRGLLSGALAVLAILTLGAVVVFGGPLILGPLGSLFGSGPTSSPTASPSPEPTALPTATPSPPPTASPTPTLEPTPEPTETPALPTPPPGSAYATLAPCPGGELCYLYTVVSGDTLYGISLKFDVTVAAIRALNPAVQDTNIIHVGQELKIPPP